jgi:hypothetical protein
MRHTKIVKWERKMKAMFDEIDDWLEDKYGDDYPLHPNRSKRGKTSNKEMDGLFNVGADFTPGYGSQFGRGYVVQVRMSTLSHIPVDVQNSVRADVEQLVRDKLPLVFPGNDLKLERDGHLLKIIGNLGLGSVIVE